MHIKDEHLNQMNQITINRVRTTCVSVKKIFLIIFFLYIINYRDSISLPGISVVYNVKNGVTWHNSNCHFLPEKDFKHFLVSNYFHNGIYHQFKTGRHTQYTKTEKIAHFLKRVPKIVYLGSIKEKQKK